MLAPQHSAAQWSGMASSPPTAEMAAASVGATLNINVGILGHVDSGKTSLSRALSSTASTNAFDKNPQSKERGITLDLGFSSFLTSLPAQLAGGAYSQMQVTLVDCPGHASLIRTIIGGAQIIDLMLLVIDVTKGIQTQTAECLVIGEILNDTLIVVLNKTDMLPEAGREEKLSKMKVRRTLFPPHRPKQPPGPTSRHTRLCPTLASGIRRAYARRSPPPSSLTRRWWPSLHGRVRLAASAPPPRLCAAPVPGRPSLRVLTTTRTASEEHSTLALLTASSRLFLRLFLQAAPSRRRATRLAALLRSG